jgi:hypothetical protein
MYRLKTGRCIHCNNQTHRVVFNTNEQIPLTITGCVENGRCVQVSCPGNSVPVVAASSTTAGLTSDKMLGWVRVAGAAVVISSLGLDVFGPGDGGLLSMLDGTEGTESMNSDSFSFSTNEGMQESPSYATSLANYNLEMAQINELGAVASGTSCDRGISNSDADLNKTKEAANNRQVNNSFDNIWEHPKQQIQKYTTIPRQQKEQEHQKTDWSNDSTALVDAMQCPNHHKCSASPRYFSCDKCKGAKGVNLPKMGCRQCDWDICSACVLESISPPQKASAVIPNSAEQQQNKVPSVLPTPIAITCLSQHDCTMTPPNSLCNVCDGANGISLPMVGCRRCNWDICHACASSQHFTAPSSIPVPIANYCQQVQQINAIAQTQAVASNNTTCGTVTSNFGAALNQTKEAANNRQVSNLCDNIWEHPKQEIQKYTTIPQQQKEQEHQKTDGSETAKAILNDMQCPNHHKCFASPSYSSCDKCKGAKGVNLPKMGCRQCNWDICSACVIESISPPQKASAVIPPSTNQKQNKAPSILPTPIAIKCLSQHDCTVTPTNSLCNVCDGANRVSLPMVGCRLCNWDICFTCASRQQQNKAPSILPSPIAIKCLSQHDCTVAPIDTTCNICGGANGISLPIVGCRLCNWDICFTCASSQHYTAPPPSIPALTVLQCPNHHNCQESRKDNRCNVCERVNGGGSTSSSSRFLPIMGCRQCNWDICSTCAARRRQPNALPSAIATAPATAPAKQQRPSSNSQRSPWF